MTRALSGRFVASLTDAGVSSVGNLAVAWAGAHLLALSDFGLLSSTILVGLIAAGLVKAMLVDPFTLTHSSNGFPADDGVLRRAFGAVVLLACALSLLTLVGGILLVTLRGGDMVWTLALGAIVIPIIIQDAFRWLCYAIGEVRFALLSSAVWTIGTWIVLAVLVWADAVSLTTFILAWGLTAALGLAAAVLGTGLRPVFAAARDWYRSAWTIGWRSSADFLLTQSVSMGSGLLIAAAAGPAAFGLVRLAQLPLAPLQVLTTGSLGYMQPTMVVHARGGETARAFRMGQATSGVLIICAVLTGIGLWLAPENLLVDLLGQEWPGAEPLILPVALTAVGSVVAACSGPFLRATGHLAFEVRWKLCAAPLACVAVLAGAVLGGASGGAFGQAVGTGLFAGPILAKAWQVHRSSSKAVGV